MESFLIIGAIFPVVLSFIIDLSAVSPDWFNRSGSLMVLCSAILEGRTRLKSLKIGGGGVIFLKSKLETTSLSLIVIGTLIWGYGDLLFKA